MASRKGPVVTATLTADAKGFKSGVNEAESSLSKFGKGLGGTGGSVGKFGKSVDGLSSQMSKGLALGALAGGAILAKFAGDAVSAASDLNEVVSKSEVVFGDSAKAVQDFAATAAKSMGQSKREALDAASTFAIFGKSAKLSGADLVKFSTDFVGLASDLASFSNTSPEEAITAIGAALRGENEPIRKYGVLIDDARLRQRAMTLGIYDGNGALNAQQKVLAAQAEIMAQTTDAQGDFARTSGGLANQQRILKAEMENLKAAIGQRLLPIVIKITHAFIELFDRLERGTAKIERFLDRTGQGFNKLEGKAVTAGHVISDVFGRGSADQFDLYGVKAHQMAVTGAAAFDNFSKASNTLSGFVGNLMRSTEKLDQVQGEYASNQGYRDSLLAQADAAKKAKDQVAKYRSTVHELANDQLGLEGALNNATDSFAEYGSTIRKGGYLTNDARDALLNAKQALFDYAAQAVTTASKAAELRGATLSDKQAVDIQVEAYRKFAKTLSPSDPLRRYIDEYIQKLLTIPGDITTTVRVEDKHGNVAQTRYGGKFAKGGIIPATPGGTLITVAEAGVDEAIVPLDGRHGMGSQTVIQNFPAGIDPRRVNDANRRWAWRNGGQAAA